MDTMGKCFMNKLDEQMRWIRWVVRSLCLVLLFVMGGEVDLYGQSSSSYPTLNKGECSGWRSAQIKRDPKRSEHMWIKILVWHTKEKSGATGFDLLAYDVSAGSSTAGEWRKLPAGDVANGLKNKLCISYSPSADNTAPDQFKPVDKTLPDTWYEIVLTDKNGHLPNDNLYLILNKYNLFHIGIAYGSTEPTTYDWDVVHGNPAPTYEDKVWLEWVQSDGRSSIIDQSKPIKVCKNGSLRLRARVDSDNPKAADEVMNVAQYNWDGWGNDYKDKAGRNDSREALFQGIHENTPITVNVNGFCNLRPSASVNVEPVKKPRLVLKGASDYCIADSKSTANTIKYDLTINGGNSLPQGSGVDSVSWIKKSMADKNSLGNYISKGSKSLTVSPNFNSTSDIQKYEIKATVWEGACGVSQTTNTTVYPYVAKPKVVAGLTSYDKDEYTSGKIEGCSPLEVKFSDTGVSSRESLRKMGLKTLWEFGDGSKEEMWVPPTDGVASYVNHKYAAGESSSTHKVKLTVSFDGKCAKSDEVTVIVHPELSADFTMKMNPNTGCAPIDLSLESTTDKTRVSKWSWIYAYHVPNPNVSGGKELVEKEWGTESELKLNKDEFLKLLPEDGRKFAETNPPRIYLRVESHEKCESSKYTELPIKYQPQMGEIKVENTEGCLPIQPKFTPEGVKEATKYYWTSYPDDGNGNPDFTAKETVLTSEENITGSGLSSFTHDFTNEKVKDSTVHVVLRVTGENECSNQKSVKVEIPGKMEPRLVVPDASGCPASNGDRTVEIKNSSLLPEGVGVDDVKWTDNQGNSLSPEPTKNSSGDFEYQLNNTSITDSEIRNIRYNVAYKGCSKHFDLKLETYPRVEVNYTLQYKDTASNTYLDWDANVKQCAPIEVKMEAKDAAKYEWTVEKNGKEVGKSLEPIYNTTWTNMEGNSMQFKVTVRGSNDKGCNGEKTGTYEVYPAYTPKIVLQVLDECNPVKIRVANDTKTGISNIKLEPKYIFQDSKGKSITPAPKELGKKGNWVDYEDATPGEKKVLLKVSGACGEKSAEAKYSVPEPVKAVISGVDPKEVCAPDKVTFSNGSTGATQYQWFFEGEGAGRNSHVVDVLDNQIHEYSNLGNGAKDYEVVLKAFNELGCEASARETVVVYPTPVAHPSAWIIDETICAPETKARVKVESTETIDKCTWTFKPEAKQAQHGKEESITDTEVSKSPWEQVLVNKQPNGSIEYKVFFEGYKNWGTKTCSLAQQEVTVLKVLPKLKLDVEFKGPKTNPTVLELCSGEEISFTNKSTGGDFQIKWDFDDRGRQLITRGATSISPQMFTNEGFTDKVFNVQLVAEQDKTGCTAKLEKEVTVHPKVEARFEQLVSDPCKYPYPVEFKNTSRVNRMLNSGTVYAWDYGYSWQNTEQKKEMKDNSSHVHEFRNPNPNTDVTYTVKLHVRQTYSPNNKVCQDEVEREVTVPPELVPRFSVNKPEGCIPHAVEFTASGSGGNDLNYLWDFGDGNTATSEGNGPTVSHEYNDLGLKNTKEYTVTLTGKKEIQKKQCSKDTTLKVKVHPKATAAFSLAKNKFCSGDVAKVENLSTNAGKFDWTIDLGGNPKNIPDAIPLEIPVTNTGRRKVEGVLKLTASETYGSITCSDDASAKFEVYPAMKTEFQMDPPEGCSPLTVKLLDGSNGVDELLWYVNGQLRAGNEKMLTETFENRSNQKDTLYKIKLLQRNEIGCKDSITKTLKVFPYVDSTFLVDGILSGCTPFTTSAQAADPSSLYTYQWTVTGGTLSSPTSDRTNIQFVNTSNPPVTTKGNLQLDVHLTANPTCKGTMRKVIEVYPKVYPDFDGDLESCSPFNGQFTNNSLVEHEAEASFTWKWAGMRSTKRDGEVYYVNPAKDKDSVFDLWLVVQSKDLCLDSMKKEVTVHPKPRAYFTMDAMSESCPPFDAQLANKSEGVNLVYSLDWGDGSPAIAPDRTDPLEHEYNNTTQTKQDYVIALKATTQHGCEDNYSQRVSVFPGVKAEFAFDPDSVSCSPFAPMLKNLSDGGRTYRWDFGDGSTVVADKTDFAHWFVNKTEQDLTLNVKLVAESEFGCKDSATHSLLLYATPRAKIDVRPPLQYYPNATVTMGNKSDPANPKWKYRWNFGDGHTSDKKDPGEHEYSHWAPKDWNYAFPVELIIESPHCSDTARQDVFIMPPRPDTRFSSDYYEACIPMAVFFTNETEYADEYVWDFGDGTTSTEREPVHIYEKPGVYHVKLVAKGEGGEFPGFRIYRAYDTPKAQFSVLPNPDSGVMLPNALVKLADETESSEPIVYYRWDYGDGFISEEESPVHRYQAPGVYNVALLVRTVHGCEDDTVGVSVHVWPEGAIIFPNAFKPNPYGPIGGAYSIEDKSNEVFHPYVKTLEHKDLSVASLVEEYELRIYNRWGEMLFETDDVRTGWDGYRDGAPCSTGVYAWHARGRFTNGKLFEMRGNVTLLR